MTKLNEIKNLKENSIVQRTENMNELQNLIDAKLLIIGNEFRFLPDLDFFEALALGCNADIFFETLILEIKTTALHFQSNYYKLANMKKDLLRESLKVLKAQYNQNHYSELRYKSLKSVSKR